MIEKIARYVHPTYIKRGIAGFTAAQTALLLGIATIWILAAVSDNKVALTWGLFRIVDTFPFFLTLIVWLVVDSRGTSAKPGIFVISVIGFVICADLASLFWFGKMYGDCTKYQDCIAVSSNTTLCDPKKNIDPLCTMGDFNKVSIYCLTLTSVLGLTNIAYGVIIGGALILLSMAKYGVNSDGYIGRHLTKNRSSQETTIQKNKHRQWGANFFFFGWLFLVAEVCFLTPFSIIKYFFAVHVIHFWPIMQVMIAYKDRMHNKISVVITSIAILFSFAGVIASGIYYNFNCTADTKNSFAGTNGKCEVTATGAIYMIILHVFCVILGLSRLVFYAYTIKNQTQTASKSSDDLDDSLFTTNSSSFMIGSRGSTYRRFASEQGSFEVTSPITGTKINV